MPIDAQTGQALPYEGEPGFEESLAENPEAYMEDTEGRLDAATALLGAAEEEEIPIAEDAEDVDSTEPTDPEVINTVFQYMNGRAPDMEDPSDVFEVQLIDSVIDASMEEQLKSQDLSVVDVVLAVHRARDIPVVSEQPGQASEEATPETFFS